jgi:cysteine desulfurase
MAEALGAAGNPSSVHAEGRRARSRIERARAQVASLVGAQPDSVVFTSGGTEANNLALSATMPNGAARLLVSPVEHPAVIDGHGLPPERVERLLLDANGLVDKADLESRLSRQGGPALIATQLANNETGILQPIEALAEIVHRHGGLLHCDAVQAAGRLPLDVAALGVDSLALSAHKLGGPMGVGALVFARGREAKARLIAGGGQERGRRGGTENVAGIVGFGVVAAIAEAGLVQESLRLGGLRTKIEQAIHELAPDAVIFGAGTARLPNTVGFAVPGLRAETALIALDLDGIAVSSGAACSSGKVHRSPVLTAMGVPADLADGAIRVSIGWTTTDDDVARFARSLETLVQRLYQRRIERAA